MTDPTLHLPVPPRAGLMTEAEILRNIAIKASARPAADNQGRPLEPATATTYSYDERGRITGVTTAPAEQPSYSAVEVEFSPTMQAMRAKAALNAESFREWHERKKTDLTGP